MKFKLLIFFSLFSYLSDAQLKHYLSYNGIAYSEFFNEQKDKFFSKTILIPALSYKVEKKKIGIELYSDFILTNYYQFGGKNIPPINSIMDIISQNIGLTFHYQALNKQFVKVNPMAGIVKNWYDAMILDYVNFTQNGEWWESIVHEDKESKTGFLIGTNINIPLYKKIYTNANIRYSVFPTAKYNKQNLIFEIGFGYMIQRKKRK